MSEPKIDFRKFASDVASANQDIGRIPVIEKEIIHYEILRTLSATGEMRHLTFQGGTSLRLCYGGVRYSEDLDFVAGEHFASIDGNKIATSLKKNLMNSFDVQVRVREPKHTKEFEAFSLERWSIVVDTAPERVDLPSQKIKLEIASVPAYTREARLIRLNYDMLPSSYGGMMVSCETVSEVAADKLISLANTFNYVRYRDVWDLAWIVSSSRINEDVVAELVAKKHKDYACEWPLSALLRRGRDVAVESPETKVFVEQLGRFLPNTVGENALLDATNRRAIGDSVASLYLDVAQKLGLSINSPEIIA